MQNITLDKTFFTLGKNGIADDKYNEEFISLVASTIKKKSTIPVAFNKINPLYETPIQSNILQRYSYGTLLTYVQDLGKTTIFETIDAIATIQYLIEKQKNGETGDLLVRGEDNFLFMKKDNGQIDRVSMYWYGEGWMIVMHTVEMSGDCGGRGGDNCFLQKK